MNLKTAFINDTISITFENKKIIVVALATVCLNRPSPRKRRSIPHFKKTSKCHGTLLSFSVFVPGVALDSSNTLKRPTSRRSTSIFGGHQSVRPTGACVCREHMVACPGSCHPAQEEWRDEGWLHPWWTSCYSKAAAATTPVTAKEEGEITTCSRRGCPDNCSRFIITRLH